MGHGADRAGHPHRAIYEGTNGVQALDLVGRKVLRDGGAALRVFVQEMAVDEVPKEYEEPLRSAFDRLLGVTDWVVAQAPEDPNLPGAASTDYLELAGLTIYAWLWARMAQIAPDEPFGEAKRRTAAFFFAKLLPQTAALDHSIRAGPGAVMGMADELF